MLVMSPVSDRLIVPADGGREGRRVRRGELSGVAIGDYRSPGGTGAGLKVWFQYHTSRMDEDCKQSAALVPNDAPLV